MALVTKPMQPEMQKNVRKAAVCDENLIQPQFEVFRAIMLGRQSTTQCP